MPSDKNGNNSVGFIIYLLEYGMKLFIEDDCGDTIDISEVINNEEVIITITDNSRDSDSCVLIDKSQAIQIIKYLTEQFTIEEKELTA